MNVFAKFDEIPSMILEVIKKTKRYGHTVSRMDGRTIGQDNVKTVYPPTNTVCGGYNKGTDKQYVTEFYIHSTINLSYLMFVPNFKILGQVVPEKYLTKISIFIT